MTGMRGLIGVAVFSIALGVGAGLGEAAGPWRGQVLDAETGQPLEGVVVLGVWEKVTPGVVHGQRDFHDVDEVVTDAEGRFVLPERNLTPINPFVSIEGPRLTMFKGGYGLWRIRGSRTEWPQDTNVRTRLFNEAMKRFGETGAVFELPPLKSRDERRRFLSTASPPSEAPSTKILRYLDAIDEERVFFGLQRSKEDRMKWEEMRKEMLR